MERFGVRDLHHANGASDHVALGICGGTTLKHQWEPLVLSGSSAPHRRTAPPTRAGSSEDAACAIQRCGGLPPPSLLFSEPHQNDNRAAAAAAASLPQSFPLILDVNDFKGDFSFDVLFGNLVNELLPTT